MSIQKKSLISTLKTTKKANVAAASGTDAKKETVSSMRVSSLRTVIMQKQVAPKGPAHFASFRRLSAKSLKTLKGQ